ncbi:MAG: amidase [Steroidobacteraceae bacterium]
MLQPMLATLILSTLLLAAGSVAKAKSADPAARFEVLEKSITELQEAMTARRISSRQVVQAYLDRIAAYDQHGPVLNAIITLNPDALEQADRLDRERAQQGPRGPLHGVPVLVKDNFGTVDMPTSGGTIALANFRPSADAFQVRRLREAGAIILGKTTMHELAMNILNVSSLTGETRNPYDPRRSPGGSSGGTGASIGASFAAAGMGTDTCGSIRVPAAYQDLFALRGSRGLSSRAGIIPLSSTEDEAGPLARSVTDLAIMLDATVGYDAEDPVTKAMKERPSPGYLANLHPGALKGARIGVLRELLTPREMNGAMRDRTIAALEAMKAQGAILVDVAIPGLDAVVREASKVIVHEFKFDFEEYLRRQPRAPIASISEMVSGGLIHEAIAERIKRRSAADKRDETAYAETLSKRDMARRMILEAMAAAQVDVLAYPSVLQPPVIWGAEPLGTATCGMSAVTGLPALALPLGLSAEMLPVGLDLLGRPFDERRLLNLAYDWERSAHPRVAPFSTPALIDGKAPGVSRFKLRLAGTNVDSPVASITFAYDPLKAVLRFKARIDRLGKDTPVALALQRSEDGKPGPVLGLMLRAGQVAGESELHLTPRMHADLAAGRLFVRLYTRKWPLGAAQASLPTH